MTVFFFFQLMQLIKYSFQQDRIPKPPKLYQERYKFRVHSHICHLIAKYYGENTQKFSVSYQKGVKLVGGKNTVFLQIIRGQYYNDKVHSLSQCQHVLITYLVLFPLTSLSSPLPTFQRKHLIMQRPSCRISKVIDVIRLLTSASIHAQNFKEGCLHKSVAFWSIRPCHHSAGNTYVRVCWDLSQTRPTLLPCGRIY